MALETKKKLAAAGTIGLGLVGAWLLFRWWQGEKVDQKPSMRQEIPSTGPRLDLLSSTLTGAQATAFKAALPDRARPYADFFLEAGRTYGVSPLVLAALMFRETQYGMACKTAACRGSTGRDWGLMQINQVHKEFMRKTVNGRPAYEDPRESIMYAAAVLRDAVRMMGKANKDGLVKVPADKAKQYGCAVSGSLKDGRPVAGMAQLRAAIAGYNSGPSFAVMALACGRDVDVVTHGGDYAAAVLAEANRLLGQVA